jgi:hypothetical protein
MEELTLQVVEDVAANGGSSSGLRSGMLPRLERARSMDEAEAAIRAALDALPWFGDTTLTPNTRRSIRDRVQQMLAAQDEIEARIATVTDAVTAQQVLVAHETLRRVMAFAVVDEPRPPPPLPPFLTPPLEFVATVGRRLVLLVVALEHLARAGKHELLAELANKAFETSQTLRRAFRSCGGDLTPWADAPAAIRARRISESARTFWNGLSAEQQHAIDDALGERVEIPWPRRPS